MKNDHLNQPTYRAGLIQSQAYRALNNFLTDYLAGYTLSVSEWKLLGQLHDSAGLAPAEISNLLGIRPPIVSRVLNTLKQKKLITKVVNKKDSRRVQVSITSRGRELVDKIEPRLRVEMRHFLGDIDRKDLETYVSVLSRLAQKL